jgi:hypothetical protein
MNVYTVHMRYYGQDVTLEMATHDRETAINFANEAKDPKYYETFVQVWEDGFVQADLTIYFDEWVPGRVSARCKL